MQTSESNAAEEWGIGAAITPTYEEIVLACMEIPQKVVIDRTMGVEMAITKGLLIQDTSDIITTASRIEYNGNLYAITSIVKSKENQSLKRVLLSKIAS